MAVARQQRACGQRQQKQSLRATVAVAEKAIGTSLRVDAVLRTLNEKENETQC